MSFIDTATGSPDLFDAEVVDAMHTLTQATPIHQDRFCVLAGAAYLAEFARRLVTINSASTVKHVGTASLRIHTVAGGVYCQAVNDRYTERWPLPWIIGADRKRTISGAKTMTDLVSVMELDLAAFRALYIPDGEAVPDTMIMRFNDNWPGVTDTPSGGDRIANIHNGGKITTIAMKAGKCSPVQQFCLDYPWMAPNRVKNYLAPATGKPVPPPVVSPEPAPAGPREKTLAEVIQERQKNSKWG